MDKIIGTKKLTSLNEPVTISGWYQTTSENWQYIGWDNGLTFVQYGMEFSSPIRDILKTQELIDYMLGAPCPDWLILK